MWNVMQSMSLVSAVLITATIQGTLLWRMNGMAIEGQSGKAQTPASSLASTPTEFPPEMRYVTLAPVVVVGRRDTFMTENMTTQVSALAPATQ